MTYLIALVLIVANITTSLTKNKGKVYIYLLLTFMWVLYWGSLDNADSENYNTLYNHVAATGSGTDDGQIGMDFLMRIATTFGLAYHQFLMIISFVGLWLITSTVKKFTNLPQIVYVFYFIYPFTVDVIQVKHFLASSIIIFSSRYLVEDGVKSDFKYIIGCLIAYTIHPIALLFLPLFLVKKIRVKALFNCAIIVNIVGIFVIKSNLLQIFLSKFSFYSRIEPYFYNMTNLGFIPQYIVQILIFILIDRCRFFLKSINENSRFVDIVYKMNIYLLIFLPLYMINLQFTRIFRVELVMNYIVFAIVVSKIRDRKSRVFILSTFVFVVILLWTYYILPSVERLFIPIFENNMVF